MIKVLLLILYFWDIWVFSLVFFLLHLFFFFLLFFIILLCTPFICLYILLFFLGLSAVPSFSVILSAWITSFSLEDYLVVSGPSFFPHLPIRGWFTENHLVVVPLLSTVADKFSVIAFFFFSCLIFFQRE